jgi:hypothetical protein
MFFCELSFGAVAEVDAASAEVEAGELALGLERKKRLKA